MLHGKARCSLASSKNSPGIHDRAPGTARATCIQMSTRSGRRCKRYTTSGSRLCSLHKGMAQGRLFAQSGPGANGSNKGGQAHKAKLEAEEIERAEADPDNRREGRSRISDNRMKAYTSATSLVISENARNALVKLGSPLSAQDKVDPRQALLDAVRSAVRQREVWESMLTAVPYDDWQYVGVPSIPGSLLSSRGARIEVIQKNLSEATKNASRIAKMAIDAGIEERLVRLAEEQSALIADTVKAAVIAAIASLHLSLTKEAATINSALGAAAVHLRLLAQAPANAAPNEIIEGIAVEMDNRPFETE
jgi:hypothetical protein